ncbi:MAG: glutaredoxin family protein [Acidimicrobiia bacterium]
MADITLFGNGHCKDCRAARSYLDQHDVAYDYVDVEAVPEAIDKVKEYNGGRTSVPVVVFGDGTHLTEPSDAELAVKLGQI